MIDDYSRLHPLTPQPRLTGRNVPGNLIGPMWGYPALLPAPAIERRGYLTGPGQWQTGAARITSPFGERTNPITKRQQFHKGIDLGIPVGTPVHAVADGQIVKLVYEGDNEWSGNAMYIKDKEGWLFGYMHLSQPLVGAGAVVRKGQPIALSGASGRVTGPHLHFAAWNPAGDPVDPVSLYPPGTFARR